MADDTTNGAQDHGQTREPSPALRTLDRLVGTWELSGDVGGTVTGSGTARDPRDRRST